MPEPTRRIKSDYVCTACSLMCDDLTIEIEGQAIVAIAPPCPLAESVLKTPPATGRAPCFVNGKSTDLGSGVAHVVELLACARAPLVAGFGGQTVECQRRAIELAERLGGVALASDRYEGAPVASITATVGEILARCDLLVAWNCDPSRVQPRLMERMRRAPHVVRVDVSQPGGGPAALATLRAIADKIALDPDDVARSTGASLARWEELGASLEQAQRPVILDFAMTAVERELAATLIGALRARGTSSLVYPGVSPGDVLAWQTGFSAGASFAQGYPEALRPGASVGSLVREGRVDALVLLGDAVASFANDAPAPFAPPAAIVFVEDSQTRIDDAEVAFGVARRATETDGNVFRCDGVALPLRAALESRLPSTVDVLVRILEGLQQSQPLR